MKFNIKPLLELGIIMWGMYLLLVCSFIIYQGCSPFTPIQSYVINIEGALAYLLMRML